MRALATRVVERGCRRRELDVRVVDPGRRRRVLAIWVVETAGAGAGTVSWQYAWWLRGYRWWVLVLGAIS